MEGFLYALAGIGLIMSIAGRYIMVRDTGGDLPWLWVIALRFIPFSELVYMVRHYNQAKKGGMISLVGMWLIVPLAGAQLWETEKQVKELLTQVKEDADEDGEDDYELPPEMLAQLPAEAASYFAQSKTMRITEKTRKVEQMETRLKWWFDQLQAKRGGLGTDAEAVKKFNAEAAAYVTYNTLTKEAASELAAMQRPRGSR